MYRYKRDNEDKINSLNRCLFDAEHGWIVLALDRLADVRQEFPDDADVEYVEALIRKDFLGQGATAEEFFLKALRADCSHKFAAFNAAKYARSWDEFQRQVGVVRIVGEGDPDLQFLQQVEENARHVRYEVLLARGAQEYYAHEKFGECAALTELSLGAGPHSLENELALRSTRAMALRELDKAAANSRAARGEGFSSDERLALQDAITELGRAIDLDPEDHTLWNFKSAWMILFCRWDEAIAAADKALEFCPEAYLKPLANKAIALAGKGQKDDARELATKALELAKKQGAEGNEDQSLAKCILDDLLEQTTVSEDEALAALAERITTGASLIAKQEIAQWRGSNPGTELLKGLQERCAAAGREWSDLYIRIVSEMLIYFCPASAWISILKLGESDSIAYEHCIYAAICIAAQDSGVLGRDARRLLIYLLLGAREPASIRRSYREVILGPAAESTAFAHLADQMRSELSTVNPNLAELVADQPPIREAEKEFARRVTLAGFSGGAKALNKRSRRDLATVEKEYHPFVGPPIMFFVMAAILVVRWFGFSPVSWSVVVPASYVAGVVLAALVSTLVQRRLRQQR